MPGSIRLFVASALTAGEEVHLDHAEARYLLHVMRRRIGAAVVLWNGRDGAWTARITLLRPGLALALPELLVSWPAERTLFAAMERRALPPPSGISPSRLLVGPEGGCTEGEIDLLA